MEFLNHTSDILGHYGVTEESIKEKICPLTESPVDPLYAWQCNEYDCSNIDKDKWSMLYGYKIRCKKERKEIEDLHERQLKTAAEHKRFCDSLEIARSIDIDKFYQYCGQLDKVITDGRQEYTQNMLINPYHKPDEKCLIYRFEGDDVAEISVVDNVFTFLGSRFDKIRSTEIKGAVGCCAVPGYMADAINVNLHLKYKMSVAGILHYDNPVYIRARNVGKYIEHVYGIKWYEYKKMRDTALWMTEIVCYDNVLYLKQEIDELIRRHATTQQKRSETF